VQKKRAQRILDDILDSARRGVPYELTFQPCGSLSAAERQRLEHALHEAYDLFMQTWIIPQVEQVKRLVDGKLC
jgi:phosphatidylserine/phosphatidylglycerophosphate/cardiolipin synthase-like enzyme